MIAMLLCVTIVNAAADMLAVGSSVEIDKVYASNPALSQWIKGEITGYAFKNYYKIRATNGINYTMPNDPRWIRPANANGVTTAPEQGTDKASATGKRTTSSVPAGVYVPGTQVEFDRVEAAVPAHGRWDSGVVLGRDTFNRYQIRGTNGITYNVQNDPRWILPAGAPQPGPRHDYLDNPLPAPSVGKTNPAPAEAGEMPPNGIYNVTNLGALHSVGELEIRGASYRGLEAAGPFQTLGGNGAALNFSGGLAGLEGCRITGANYMGLNKLGQAVIKIRYVSPKGFNEELEATKER